MLRRFRSDLLVAGLLFALPLLLFWQVTIGGRTLIPADNLTLFEPWRSAAAQLGVTGPPHNNLLSDLVLQNYLWKKFIRESLAAGEAPLWNPYTFTGVPFLAAGQHSALYPFSLFYYVLPLAGAYGWFTVSQFFIAGLFMYVYLRVLGLRRLGAAFGAVLYQLCGFMVVSVVFQMIIAAAAWLPLILAALELIARQQPALGGRPATVPWLALGAIALGMQVLAGHVEITYYTLMVSGAYAAWRLGAMLEQALDLPWAGRQQVEGQKGKGGRSGRLRWVVGRAAAMLGLVIFGLGLAAIQFVPLYELASSSFRTGRATFEQILGWAYPLRHAIVFLIPNFYGSPAHHHYFDLFTFQWTPAPLNDQTIFWGIKNYVEGGAYLGLLPLLFALIALATFVRLRWRTRSPLPPHGALHSLLPFSFFHLVPFFSLLALFSLLFAFGTPLYALIFWLPGINQLHSPFRWVWPLTLSVAVLSAYGVQCLQAGMGRPQTADRRRRGSESSSWINALAYGAVGAGALTLIGLGAVWWQFDRFAGLLDRAVAELALASQAFSDGRMFFSYTAPWTALFGLILIASGLGLWLSRSEARLFGRPAWGAAALAVLALDLLSAAWGFNPAADPKLLAYVPPSAQFLLQDTGIWRFTSFDPTGAKPYNANVGWYFNFQDVRGYDSLFTRQYADYMKLINPQYELDFNRIAPLSEFDALNSPLLDVLNVKYVVSVVEIPNNKYTLVYNGEVKIYRNETAMPRAWLMPRTATLAVDDFAQAVQQFNPREYVMVAPEEALGVELALAAPYTAATVTGYTPNEVFVDAAAREPSWLILADAYYPDWKAFVRPRGGSEDDERELRVVRVNGHLRGVTLEPGEWTVRFKYTPVSVRLGGVLSVLSGVTLAFLVGVWLWRYFYRESQVGATARRIAKNALAPIALNLLNRAMDMVFAAFMLRVLGPADAGKYYYAIVIFGWFEIITNYGLNTFLTREVSRDRAYANRYLVNTTLLRLALGVVVIPGLALLLTLFYFWPSLPLPFAAQIEPLTADTLWAIGLLVLAQAPATVSLGLSALFYAYEKAEFPAAVSTITTLIKVGLGAVVLILGFGFVGLAGTSIVVNVVTLAILGALAWRLFFRPRWEWDGNLQRSALRESFPLMLNNLLATIFFKVDVTLLKPLRGSVEVGWYSAGYKFIDAFNLVPSLFTQALFPLLARQAGQSERRDALRSTYAFAVKLLTIIVLPLAVVTTFLADLLIGVLGGAEFLPFGALALIVLAWSMPFGWINSVTNYVLIAAGQQRALTRAFAVAVIFNVVVNVMVIPTYGFLGAATVTIASEVFEGLAFYYYVHRHVGRLPWLRLLWRPWLSAGLMALAMGAVWPFSPPAGLLMGLLTYGVAVAKLEAFNAEERATLASILPSSLRQRLVR